MADAMQERSGLRHEVESLKRQRLLEEARRLFYELGYHKTTMDALADAVGMGKPFVYRHFRNKLDLLTELYDRAITLSAEALEQALAEHDSPEARIRGFVRRYLNVVVNEREIVAIYFREAMNIPEEQLARLDDHKRAFDDQLARVIRQGIDDGVFNVSSARIAAFAIVGMVNWSYQWYRSTGPLDSEALGDIFADFAIRLLRSEEPLPPMAGSAKEGGES